MGDTESLLVSFLILVLFIIPFSKGHYGIAILIPIILTSILITDTATAILCHIKKLY